MRHPPTHSPLGHAQAATKGTFGQHYAELQEFYAEHGHCQARCRAGVGPFLSCRGQPLDRLTKQCQNSNTDSYQRAAHLLSTSG